MKDAKTVNRGPKPVNKSKSNYTIKTFPNSLKIRRSLSSGARAANRPRREYQRLDSAENPTQYANDRSVQGSADAARASIKAAKTAVRGGKKVLQKLRQRNRQIKELNRDIKLREPTEVARATETPARSASYRGGRQNTMKAARRNANTRSAIRNTAKNASNAGKATKSTAKAAAKAPRAAIKTTQRTMKLTARTVKTTAKTAKTAVTMS